MQIIAQSTRPESRSSHDNLTKTERAALYLPENYRVERLSPVRFRAVNRVNGCVFEAVQPYGLDDFEVTSNTGGVYRVFRGLCPCKDSERKREAGCVGDCKHSAVSLAIKRFIQCERTEADQQTIRERCKRDIEKTFGPEPVRPSYPTAPVPVPALPPLREWERAIIS